MELYPFGPVWCCSFGKRVPFGTAHSTVSAGKCPVLGQLMGQTYTGPLLHGFNIDASQISRVAAKMSFQSQAQDSFRNWPYGMDCSGFLDWIAYNISSGSYVIDHSGDARIRHYCCTLIFHYRPNQAILCSVRRTPPLTLREVGMRTEIPKSWINLVIIGKARINAIGGPSCCGWKCILRLYSKNK